MAVDHGPRFVALCESARKRIKEANVHQVQQWQQEGKGFILIDVREESEWAADHLPEAIHLGKGVIERDIEARIADRSQWLMLYCGGGYRSALAADNLRQMGYTNAWSMDGGYRGWKDAGYRLVKS